MYFTCIDCFATYEETITIYCVTVESKTALIGKTVTVGITFSNKVSVKSIGVDTLSYDHTALELISGEWIGADGAVMQSFDLDMELAVLAFEENTKTSGLSLSLTFKVADDAKEGEYEIGCNAVVTKMDGEDEKMLTVLVNTGTISVCDYERGDVNGDESVDTNDAIHLLRHVLFSSKFSINQNGDFDNNSRVNSNDAIYLLRHVLFPSKFPLS